MSDPVYLSNFLRQASWGGVLLGHDEVDALLAYGGGDPVVIMPDGELKRLHRVTEGRFPLHLIIDPVQP